MKLRHRSLGFAFLATFFGLAGCGTTGRSSLRPTTPAAHPAAKAAASGMIPNTQVNPTLSIDSQLPDPFIYRDTVQHMAANSVSLRVNDLFQAVMTEYTRFKFPQTANPASSASGGPDILISLTYLNFDSRWSISQIFTVDAVIDMKVDVRKGGKINERVLRAAGQGRGDDAFQDATKAAIRNGIPVLDQYLSSLNL